MVLRSFALFCITLTTTPVFASFSSILGKASEKVAYFGTIQYPEMVQNPSRLAFLYKGKIYNIQVHKGELIAKGDVQIYEDKNIKELRFLVTESLKLPTSSAITHLETSKDHPYLYFKFVRNQKTDPENENVTLYYWDIQELSNEEAEIKIPENTIVFLMKPDLELFSIAPASWHADDPIIKLPAIVFNDVKNEDSFNKLCARMMLNLLEINFLHTKSTKTSRQVAKNCIVSVPNPSNRYVS